MENKEITTLCGLNCCGQCSWKGRCGGCLETGGSPFGGSCIAARQIKQGGLEAFLRLKDLNLLNGFYINLSYPLPNGKTVQLLEDKDIYLGNQAEIPGSCRCYGLIGDETHLLVCEYSNGGLDPEIVVYKRRDG